MMLLVKQVVWLRGLLIMVSQLRFFGTKINSEFTVHILLERAEKVIERCPCESGCTSCGCFGVTVKIMFKYYRRTGIQSNICKDANLISSKVGARIIFNGLLGRIGVGEVRVAISDKIRFE